MRKWVNIIWIVIWAAMIIGGAQVNHGAPDTGNAALRYWAPFSELQDSAVTVQQAKELNSILDGTAQYNDAKYRELIKKNQLALEIMSRGTRLGTCDWGLDYGLGANMPVEYAREGLALGRLNVLYIFQLLQEGNMEEAVRALVAGLRFSRDVSSGGSLFATIVAKSLLTDHLRAITDVLRLGQLTRDQNSRLQTAVEGLSEGLDWSSAAKRDLELLRGDYTQSSQAAASLKRITTLYIAALNNESNSAAAEQAIKAAPNDLGKIIPNLGGVLKAKHDLEEVIHRSRAAFP